MKSKSLSISEHLSHSIGLRCTVYRIDSSPNSVTLLPILMTVEPIDVLRNGSRYINCAVNIIS